MFQKSILTCSYLFVPLELTLKVMSSHDLNSSHVIIVFLVYLSRRLEVLDIMQTHHCQPCLFGLEFSEQQMVLMRYTDERSLNMKSWDKICLSSSPTVAKKIFAVFLSDYLSINMVDFLFPKVFHFTHIHIITVWMCWFGEGHCKWGGLSSYGQA